jgi:nucleotide-binding universal stress UspA family protein
LLGWIVMIERILVPTDFSEHAALALRHARELARLFGAEIRLLSAAFLSPVWVAEGAAPIPDEYRKAVLSQVEDDLQRVARTLREDGVRVSCAVSSDHPASAIRRAAHDWPADLIAMGTHGRTGLPHALLGSIAERTVRFASAPVLTVRAEAGEPRPLRNVLVATDFSGDAQRALEWSVALARRADARVSLVHAVAGAVAFGQEELALESVRAAQWAATEAARGKLERMRAELGALAGEIAVEEGRADGVIADAARRLSADLIAVGTRGRSGLGHVLMGSTAERVLRRAPVPTVVLRADSARAQ